MKRKKLNCWEYKKCGREPGGISVESLGVCPAASDTSFETINSGICGGRFCWAVAGTFCGGEVQGSFAQKRDFCFNCDFYKLVHEEEGTANLSTKFSRFVFPEFGPPLLKNPQLKYIKAGTRFITQGSPAGVSYIIQRGACLVTVEKDGEIKPIDHRVAGDIVGAKSAITGEPHSAHCEAETDLELWVLEKQVFDNITREYPDLLFFLTEIVADRFDSHRPIAERSIGKYIATDIIGRGGFSIVYKGIEADSGRPVAIKMLRHDLAMDSDFISCFRNEAEIIARLDHPNIIKVFEILEQFRTVFIVMEYFEGEALSDLIKKKNAFDAAVVADILKKILHGLGYAHDKGIIHRDINPHNIIVQGNEHLKILDFGFACPIGTNDLHMGTIFYTPPEQIAGEPMDQRADIYSLGIMAYEMVTGKRPFPENNLGDLIESHLEKEIPDPAKIAPDIPTELQTFIIRACRCAQAERLHDVNESLEILKPLIGTLPSKKQASVLETYGISHVGLVRPVNEDRYLIKEYNDGTVLVTVADGMGGAAGGSVAAQIMIENLDRLPSTVVEAEKQLADLVIYTDLAILAEAEKNPELEGMGTTVTGALIRNGTAYWFHVGDSRLYLLRDEELKQITTDQNLAKYYIEKGEITPEEARFDQSRHFLEQNVGCGVCKPETGALKLKNGDLLMCTTDGVGEDLPMETITELIKSEVDIKKKADSLMHSALHAGARDNVTIVIAKL